MTVQRPNPTLEGQVADTSRRVADLRNTALQRIAQKGGRVLDSVKRFAPDVTTTATSFSGATQLLASNPIQVYVGRFYYIYVPQLGMYLNGSVNGIMGSMINFTTDGSTPTNSSGAFAEAYIIVSTLDFVSTTTLGGTYFPATDHTLRTRLAFWRQHTGGSSTRGGAYANTGIELTVFDMGTDV